MTEQEIRQQLSEFERTFAAGWDDGGCTGLKQPYSWESCARVALDLARAAIRSSPPPALAVEELDKEVARWQDYRDKYPAEACCATSRIDSLLTLRGILIALGVAAVQSSRSGEPGTCATCQHHLRKFTCEADVMRPGDDTDEDFDKVCEGLHFGCSLHTPQEPSR